MNSSKPARLHLLISGLVQGVYFRVSALEKAKKLGLTGFVHNLADGRVEIIAEGAQPKLVALERWCYHGVKGAQVDRVDSEWGKASGEFESFSIR